MSESDIQKVMDRFGFDRIQARNHVKCQQILAASSPSARAPVMHSRTEQVVADASAKPFGDGTTTT